MLAENSWHPPLNSRTSKGAFDKSARHPLPADGARDGICPPMPPAGSASATPRPARVLKRGMVSCWLGATRQKQAAAVRRPRAAARAHNEGGGPCRHFCLLSMTPFQSPSPKAGVGAIVFQVKSKKNFQGLVTCCLSRRLKDLKDLTVLLDPRVPLLHSERTQGFAADPVYGRAKCLPMLGSLKT